MIHEAVCQAVATGDEQQCDCGAAYWLRRDIRVVTEMFMLYAGHGMSLDKLGADRWSVSAEPAEPDDNNPEEPREYFVHAPYMKHAPNGGLVTGIGVRKYRVTLEPVGEDS